MKKLSIALATVVAAAVVLTVAHLSAQDTITVPKLQYRAIYDFFKITPDTNFGEVLGVAVNSKGNVVVLNHPGTASSGPLYGNATTQLLEFDANGKFVREWGKGVEVTTEPTLADGTVEQIAKALEQFPGDCTVAIVGHEPDFSELLARILGTPNAERLTFKKGGAALVELPGSLLEGGALLWYLPPRLLRQVR